MFDYDRLISLVEEFIKQNKERLSAIEHAFIQRYDVEFYIQFFRALEGVVKNDKKGYPVLYKLFDLLQNLSTINFNARKRRGSSSSSTAWDKILLIPKNLLMSVCQNGNLLTILENLESGERSKLLLRLNFNRLEPSERLNLFAVNLKDNDQLNDVALDKSGEHEFTVGLHLINCLRLLPDEEKERSSKTLLCSAIPQLNCMLLRATEQQAFPLGELFNVMPLIEINRLLHFFTCAISWQKQVIYAKDIVPFLKGLTAREWYAFLGFGVTLTLISDSEWELLINQLCCGDWFNLICNNGQFAQLLGILPETKRNTLLNKLPEQVIDEVLENSNPKISLNEYVKSYAPKDCLVLTQKYSRQAFIETHSGNDPFTVNLRNVLSNYIPGLSTEKILEQLSNLADAIQQHEQLKICLQLLPLAVYREFFSSHFLPKCKSLIVSADDIFAMAEVLVGERKIIFLLKILNEGILWEKLTTVTQLCDFLRILPVEYQTLFYQTIPIEKRAALLNDLSGNIPHLPLLALEKIMQFVVRVLEAEKNLISGKLLLQLMNNLPENKRLKLFNIVETSEWGRLFRNVNEFLEIAQTLNNNCINFFIQNLSDDVFDKLFSLQDIIKVYQSAGFAKASCLPELFWARWLKGRQQLTILLKELPINSCRAFLEKSKQFLEEFITTVDELVNLFPEPEHANNIQLLSVISVKLWRKLITDISQFRQLLLKVSPSHFSAIVEPVLLRVLVFSDFSQLCEALPAEKRKILIYYLPAIPFANYFKTPQQLLTYLSGFNYNDIVQIMGKMPQDWLSILFGKIEAINELLEGINADIAGLILLQLPAHYLNHYCKRKDQFLKLLKEQNPMPGAKFIASLPNIIVQSLFNSIEELLAFLAELSPIKTSFILEKIANIRMILITYIGVGVSFSLDKLIMVLRVMPITKTALSIIERYQGAISVESLSMYFKGQAEPNGHDLFHALCVLPQDHRALFLTEIPTALQYLAKLIGKNSRRVLIIIRELPRVKSMEFLQQFTDGELRELFGTNIGNIRQVQNVLPDEFRQQFINRLGLSVEQLFILDSQNTHDSEVNRSISRSARKLYDYFVGSDLLAASARLEQAEHRLIAFINLIPIKDLSGAQVDMAQLEKNVIDDAIKKQKEFKGKKDLHANEPPDMEIIALASRKIRLTQREKDYALAAVKRIQDSKDMRILNPSGNPNDIFRMSLRLGFQLAILAAEDKINLVEVVAALEDEDIPDRYLGLVRKLIESQREALGEMPACSGGTFNKFFEGLQGVSGLVELIKSDDMVKWDARNYFDNASREFPTLVGEEFFDHTTFSDQDEIRKSWPALLEIPYHEGYTPAHKFAQHIKRKFADKFNKLTEKQVNDLLEGIAYLNLDEIRIDEKVLTEVAPAVAQSSEAILNKDSMLLTLSSDGNFSRSITPVVMQVSSAAVAILLTDSKTVADVVTDSVSATRMEIIPSDSNDSNANVDDKDRTIVTMPVAPNTTKSKEGNNSKKRSMAEMLAESLSAAINPEVNSFSSGKITREPIGDDIGPDIENADGATHAQKKK